MVQDPKTHIEPYFFICTSNFALAEGIADLSFKPFTVCKMAPISPPQKILKKSYKTYIFPGNWSIFDINGDGWCDWVRGGNEGYRSDEEYPPLREFIYLGTAKGWRYFDQKKVKLQSRIVEPEIGKTVVLPGSAAALNFVEPIAIYAKGKARPYIVTVVRFDAPAPPPDRKNIMVFKWNEELDKLQIVSEGERKLMIGFLHEKLCKDRPELTIYGDSPFLLAQGDLCFPRE
jgi:hypothetical protein